LPFLSDYYPKISGKSRYFFEEFFDNSIATQLFKVIVRKLPEKAKRLKIVVAEMGNFSFKTIVIQTFN
jgi:hypothetical protein